jgi:DNA-binding transcriptional ArsR family regulator
LTATARTFAALGDEHRLRIVKRLGSEGPQSIASLTRNAKVTRQAVTKHLRVLQQAGLLKPEKQGREKLWRLDPAKLSLAKEQLDEISRLWDRRLEVLKALVEG